MSDGDLKNIETSHSSLYCNSVLDFLLCDCVDVCSQNKRMIYFCLFSNGNATYRAVLLHKSTGLMKLFIDDTLENFYQRNTFLPKFRLIRF